MGKLISLICERFQDFIIRELNKKIRMAQITVAMPTV